MAKAINVKRKRPGRPATGLDPITGVRFPAATTAAIDAWAKKNKVQTRSDAIRRLVELGLKEKREKPDAG